MNESEVARECDKLSTLDELKAELRKSWRFRCWYYWFKLTDRPSFRIQPFFKWFDFWIGVYIDVDNKTLYICPVPMFGFKITRVT